MTFADDLNRMLAEGYERMATDIGPPDTPFLCDAPRVTITSNTAYVPASLELLVDSGAITEAEARARGWTPPPSPSRRARLRWRWQAWRERTGRKLGGWMAGVDLSERNEDW